MDDDRLSRLVEAVISIAGDLGLEQTLRRIVEAARDVVDAQYAALGVIDHRASTDGREDRTPLSSFIHVGMEDSVVERIGHLPEGHGILGLLIEHPDALRLADLATHPASYGFPPGHPPMGTFLGAPVRVHGQIFGNLYLTEKANGAEFTLADQELIEALAAVAGSAIANADLFVEVKRLSLIEDRERIGRDLHDTVIQRLFATGLSLQALSRRAENDPVLMERIKEAVDDLDDTIREIRGVIFSLQESGARAGLRSGVAELCNELVPVLGVVPKIRYEGPVDLLAGPELADQVLRVLREALTNVARHARASSVSVMVEATPSRVTLVVTDDGVGLPEVRREGAMGLGNLEGRATDLGGSFEATSEEGGTTLRWSVPI